MDTLTQMRGNAAPSLEGIGWRDTRFKCSVPQCIKGPGVTVPLWGRGLNACTCAPQQSIPMLGLS